MIQRQLVKLQHEGLTIHKGRDTEHNFKVRLGIFGDMGFINSTLGSGRCSTNNCCPKCDCEKYQLMLSRDEFEHQNLSHPLPMTIRRRNMLAHALWTGIRT